MLFSRKNKEAELSNRMEKVEMTLTKCVKYLGDNITKDLASCPSLSAATNVESNLLVVLVAVLHCKLLFL